MTQDAVPAVTWAARYPLLRNTLVAAAAVVLTATGVTAALVWPVGHASRVSCPSEHTLVAVQPFALPLGAAGDLAPTPAAEHDGTVRLPLITGCVGPSDLTPAGPGHPDERG
jgi:hypothetical protein